MKIHLQNWQGLLLNLGLVVLFCPFITVKAQDMSKIKREVIIQNGDTTFNGKKISEMSKTEREQLVKELQTFEKDLNVDERLFIKRKSNENKDVFTDKRMPLPHPDDKDLKVLGFQFKNIELKTQPNGLDNDSIKFFPKDSVLKNIRFYANEPLGIEYRIMERRKENSDRRPFLDGGPGEEFMDRPYIEFKRHPENAQAFNYNHTDKDGISTRVSFRVNEAEESSLQKITASQNPVQNDVVLDLILFPNFSSGKTTLSFRMAEKKSAELKIWDNNLKVLYSERLSDSNYNKQIVLPKNGIYYLSVKQDKNWFVRQVTKK